MQGFIKSVNIVPKVPAWTVMALTSEQISEGASPDI